MPTPKTYSAMLKHIAQLQVQAEALRMKESAGVIKRMQEAMQAYGIRPEDLIPKPKSHHKAKPQRAKSKVPRKSRGPGKKTLAKLMAAPPILQHIPTKRATPKKPATKRPTAKKNRGPSPFRGKKKLAKYADNKGNTWAGGGSMPLWLREQTAGGKDIEEFRVKKASG